MRPDLIATREALPSAAGAAQAQLELSIDIARSGACDRAFLKTSFEAARSAAAR